MATSGRTATASTLSLTSSSAPSSNNSKPCYRTGYSTPPAQKVNADYADTHYSPSPAVSIIRNSNGKQGSIKSPSGRANLQQQMVQDNKTSNKKRSRDSPYRSTDSGDDSEEDSRKALLKKNKTATPSPSKDKHSVTVVKTGSPGNQTKTQGQSAHTTPSKTKRNISKDQSSPYNEPISNGKKSLRQGTPSSEVTKYISNRKASIGAESSGDESNTSSRKSRESRQGSASSLKGYTSSSSKGSRKTKEKLRSEKSRRESESSSESDYPDRSSKGEGTSRKLSKSKMQKKILASASNGSKPSKSHKRTPTSSSSSDDGSEDELKTKTGKLAIKDKKRSASLDISKRKQTVHKKSNQRKDGIQDLIANSIRKRTRSSSVPGAKDIDRAECVMCAPEATADILFLCAVCDERYPPQHRKSDWLESLSEH